MKKFVLLLSVLFAFQFVLKAQVAMDTAYVVFNAHLLETFDINVTLGENQDITFATPADYNEGVVGGIGILPGSSTVTVNATANWDITIEAADFTGYDGPNGAGGGSIPINNLGVYCQSIGSFSFGTQLTCAYQAAGDALGLTNGPTILIGNGTGNTGGTAENQFILNWLMGTMQGTMNGSTMFSQLASGQFTLGDFTTEALLTLRKL